MTKETIFCDRCGKEIIYPITVKTRLYKGKHFKLTDRDKRVDLCQDCCDGLNNWFRVGANWVKAGSDDFLSCSNCGWEFAKPNKDFDELYPSWTPLDFNYCPMCGRRIYKDR